MTMTNKGDEVQTAEITFRKSESNYTPEELSRIVDTLGRAVLKDIWNSLETEEDRAHFRSINGHIFDDNTNLE
ncbi:hypothetical protein OGZ51_10450 [Lactococcus lactis]|uniref:Uncharacterized protein n=2 Tax=Lactococcus lactis TaxID=1358 RepID=A0A9X4NIA0_9LACT|nr:hypothetical protein [Lactococcus lactis]